MISFPTGMRHFQRPSGTWGIFLYHSPPIIMTIHLQARWDRSHRTLLRKSRADATSHLPWCALSWSWHACDRGVEDRNVDFSGISLENFRQFERFYVESIRCWDEGNGSHFADMLAIFFCHLRRYSMAFISTGIGIIFRTGMVHTYLRNYPASPFSVSNT